MTTTGAGTPDPEEVAAHRERLLDGLRAFGASYAELTRRFAAHLGLRSSEASALVEILIAEDKGTPLTPARLADRVGLTSGAMTNLLHRLEAAGHVERRRDQVDRRRVTLRCSPRLWGPAQAFFGGMLIERFDAMVAQYPEPSLAEIETFLGHLRTTMDAVLADGPEAP